MSGYNFVTQTSFPRVVAESSQMKASGFPWELPKHQITTGWSLHYEVFSKRESKTEI